MTCARVQFRYRYTDSSGHQQVACYDQVMTYEDREPTMAEFIGALTGQCSP